MAITHHHEHEAAAAPPNKPPGGTGGEGAGAEPHGRKLWPWLAGGALAIAAVLGIYETSKDSPREPTIAEEIATTSTTAPVPETSLPPQEALSEPVLMTATTPNELLKQFEQNMNCFFSRQPEDIRQKCFSTITGNKTTGVAQTLRNSPIPDNLKNDPRLTFHFSAELTSPDAFKITTSRAILVANVTESKSVAHVVQSKSGPNTADSSETGVVRLTFDKSTAVVKTLQAEDSVVPVWVLVGNEPLKPGEVSFPK